MSGELTLEKLTQIVKEETNLNMDGFTETGSFSDFFKKNGLEDDMMGEFQYRNICFRIEDDYGIRIRCPDDWYVWTAEKWVKWVNRMVRENDLITRGKLMTAGFITGSLIL